MQALHSHKLVQLQGLPARTSLHPLRKSPDSCSRISLRPTAQSDSCEGYQEPEDTVNRSTLLRQSAILAAGSATMGTGTSSARAQPSPLQPTQDFQVTMQTLADSELGVSRYPIFSYDSRGGGGMAKAEKRPGNKLFVSFDLAQLSIPDVNYRTAKFLGVPMAPPFRIHIKPSKLEGTIDRETGQAELQFIADFMFTAGFLYKAPPLKVTTNLTTEHVKGTVREGDGKRLDKQGYSRLVGVATVPKTGSIPIDKFLSLPNEAYAVMSSQFCFHAADTPDEATNSLT